MPNAYEFAYGNVIFEEPDGTPIFETADDLGLWLVEDSEPSPEPKWVRVDVPGADGSVDLSRALTGQVQYERRNITMRFAGEEADHATALALVHRMRRALHGARVRMTTMLTAQISGYYVADCECDGTADAGGGVEVTVTATAEPFIRIGTQTLALPFVGPYAQNGSVIETPDGFDPTTATYLVELDGTPGSYVCPIGADVVRLWWAMGENLFDPSMWPYAGSSTGYSYPWPTLDGQRVRVSTTSTTGTTRLQLKASDRTGTWPSWPYSFPFTGTDAGSGSTAHLVAYVTGTVTSVGSSPHVKVTLVEDGTGTDSDGFVQGTTTSDSFTPTVGTVSQTLAVTPVGGLVSAIDVEAKNVAGSITVGLALVVGTAPASWEAATLGYADAVLDSPVGWYDTTSDRVFIRPYDSEVLHFVIHDEGTSAGTTSTDAAISVSGMPPANAAYVSAALMCDGGPSGQVSIDAAFPTPCTATGTNTTMRSTPSVTTADGAEVTIDGRTAIVGPGTVELPALVIPGGAFTVEYTIFGAVAPDGTLTWEGGAL